MKLEQILQADLKKEVRVLVCAASVGTSQEPVGRVLITIGNDTDGIAKITVRDLKKYEDLMESLLLFKGGKTAFSFRDAFPQLDEHLDFKVSGTKNEFWRAAWAERAGWTLDQFWQYCLRAVARVRVSRYRNHQRPKGSPVQ